MHLPAKAITTLPNPSPIESKPLNAKFKFINLRIAFAHGICDNKNEIVCEVCDHARKLQQRWIAKVTSGLHDLFPSFQKSCKIKFRESNVTLENLEVNFANIAEPGTYSYKGN